MRKLSSVSLCLLGVLGCGDDGGSGGGGGQGATSTSSSGQTSSGQTTSSSTTTTTTGVGGGGTGGGGGGGGLVGGEIIWQRPTNVTSLIGTDEAGNLYAGGPGVDGDFGPQPATIPVDGAFYTLAKIDPTGQTVIWRKTYAATVSAMSVGRDGAVVLGHLTGLIKLDPDGNEIWTIPTPLGGGPFVLSTDGRVWGQRSVVDGAGAVTSWRAPGGFITLAEWDAGEHVVGVKRDSQNAVYLVDATNLDGSPAWSKSVPKPTCTSCAVRLTLHASVGGRTFIRQDFPSDPGVTFDIGCGPLSSALISLAPDGSCEWSTPLPEPTSAFDIAAHSAVNGVVLRNDNAVRLFDLAQGSEQWSFPGAPAAFLVPAANEGPAVYVLGFSQGGTSGGVARIQ